jgi:hypothetical protein
MSSREALHVVADASGPSAAVRLRTSRLVAERPREGGDSRSAKFCFSSRQATAAILDERVLMIVLHCAIRYISHRRTIGAIQIELMAQSYTRMLSEHAVKRGGAPELESP